ncbi:hypothetical protein FGIG_11767 [Fasciola gigantica]|uniref:Uncharacterized protein n=1 Tax=Fasciola gigantica TaxID=46835 RepID=A0A504WSP8_FASGI|nr:hypothetical protein FGIG_11767 [Fasciola gigantica]
MPRSDILHAVHELTNFSDKYVEQKYGIPDGKHYYHINKRKRKTIPPQKRDLSDDEMEDTHSSGHESMEHDEPINLMKRDTDANHAAELTGGKNLEPMGVTSNLSVEQNRMYNILLNYLLMKYNLQSDLKDGTNNNPVNKLFGRYPDITPQHPGAPFATPLFHSLIPSTLSCNFGDKVNCSREFLSVDGASSTSNPLKPNTIRYGLCENEPWKQSILNALNTCINNIPIPKSGYDNYDTMLLCYKSLIEKAFSLQQAVDIYLNLLQTAPAPDLASSDNINGCIASRFPAIFSPRFGWSQPVSLTPVVSTSSPGIEGAISSVEKSANDVHSNQNISGDWENGDKVFRCENNVSSDLRLTACPVDLTKAEKRCQSVQLTSNLRTQRVPSGIEVAEKLGKEGAHFLSRLFNSTKTEISTHSDYNGISSHNSSTDFNLSPSSDKFEFSPRSLKDQGSLNSSRLGETTSSMENNCLSVGARSGLSLRRKSYFKTKRLKKSFCSTANSIINDSSDSNQVKKSNFRGTSEEENRVANRISQPMKNLREQPFYVFFVSLV